MTPIELLTYSRNWEKWDNIVLLLTNICQQIKACKNLTFDNFKQEDIYQILIYFNSLINI